MDVKGQSVEQFLLEQLQKVAPGKYTVAGVLEQFKAKLRFPCNHLKGGSRIIRPSGLRKDYNLSIFTFPNRVTEIKCLYNCGLKIRSDEKELTEAFDYLSDLPTTNTKAATESLLKRNHPEPVPTYSDAYRRRIRESSDRFWNAVTEGLENGRIQPNDLILGGIFPHPGPVEAPDSIVEREMMRVYRKNKKPAPRPLITVEDIVPGQVKSFTKIRKTRKAQSRKRG